MQDVDRRLAFHPRLDRKPGEVVRRVTDVVPAELQRYRAVIRLAQEDDPAGLHAGSVAHQLGYDDLPFRPDLGRSGPIKRDPVSCHPSPPVLPDAHSITISTLCNLLADRMAPPLD
jgi:hypothetical protein